ncbi:hypothetical protein ASG06_15710 [Rathayibacter sp. Leaf185]|nr:hypothetical protein ASF42_15710 [Rathayibacter sp. Leaf294]KQS10966.1 hypothetical protein ASG06_15710 [Rathayibacter sp. Leaf185]
MSAFGGRRHFLAQVGYDERRTLFIGLPRGGPLDVLAIVLDITSSVKGSAAEASASATPPSASCSVASCS